MKKIEVILGQALLVMIAAVVCGCTDDLSLGEQLILDDAQRVECKMALTVSDFAVSSSSRAAEPDAEADNTASDQEKSIRDIWLFQFDSTGKLLISPQYYTAEADRDDTGNWTVLLKEDVVSTVYVVTNTGDTKWASTASDFATIEKLKEYNLPNPDPIEVNDGDVFYIPMQGSKSDVTIKQNSVVKVDVERMYAKLIVLPPALTDKMDLRAIEVNNIPWTCQVGSRSCSDDDATSEKEAAEYPSDAQWITRAYNAAEDETTDKEEETGEYVLYIPENIQGKVSSANKLKSTDIPTNALTVRYRLNVNVADDGSDDAILQTSAAVYPGDNNTDNFNIKRNRIYRIKAQFPSESYFSPTPSSNCFIVEPGKAVVFYPYYRTEKGGGYTIKDYLDPTDESKTIKAVRIIWQDKDVIGDNTDGDLVTMTTIDDSETEGFSDEEKYDYILKHFKIKVQTQGEGNALIAAYNNEDYTKGDIIWSWHIWVTDNDPANVANAISYMTYSWDNSGIHADPDNPSEAARIKGYSVMPCNLGALEFEPTAGKPKSDTYGLQYQWGRKDPFPIMKTQYIWNGYSEKLELYSDYSMEPQGANVDVYDNSNERIAMTGNGSEGAAETTEVFQTVRCTSTSLASDEDTQRADGIRYSISHPTTFISATDGQYKYWADFNNQRYVHYVNNGDWLLGHDDKLWGGLEPDLSQNHLEVSSVYYTKSGLSNRIPYLWDNYGDEKTIFDPSPSGWRVSPPELWISLSATGLSISRESIVGTTGMPGSFSVGDKGDEKFLSLVNTQNTDLETIANNNGFYMYLDGWKGSSHTTFFPCPGVRIASGQTMNLGMCGNYHNACSSPQVLGGKIIRDDKVNCLHFHSQWKSVSWVYRYMQVNIFEIQPVFVTKALASQIRCVRDHL